MKCKYFAVPLDPNEMGSHHCPGANPLGDPTKKICVLRGREGFDDHKLDPDNCSYFFPVALRFR